MNLQPKVTNEHESYLDQILSTCSGSENTYPRQIANQHLSIYAKYWKDVVVKGPAAFPNRLEYQKFQVAKLYLDRLNMLEFSVDPSLERCENYKDMKSPPLDAFNMSSDTKKTRKITFCSNIEKGDILHLRVVEESETEYKLLVINKYNENERVVDYFIHAYLLKTYLLDKKMPRNLQISDLIRATVLNKPIMEEKNVSKLLVTVDENFVSDKNRDVRLGLVFESEIPFYPVNVTMHPSYMKYLKTENSENLQEITNCMTFLGIDPHKTYSFHLPSDGEKLGVSKSCLGEEEMMEKSMSLIREVEGHILEDGNIKLALEKTEEALKCYPQNDAAYAVRGQLYKTLYLSDKNPDYLRKALSDLDKSLELNSYNIIATREYLAVLLMSSKHYKNDGDKAKAREIKKKVYGYKDVCKISHVKAASKEP